MNISPFRFPYCIIILYPFLAYGQIDPAGKDASTEIVENAKRLVAEGDFASIDAMIADIDFKYGDKRNAEYFRSLLGVFNALVPHYTKPSEAEYPRLWFRRKLLWKILLTQYSNIEDALQVQKMKDALSRFIRTPAPAFESAYERNQFVAMRKDAVALLEAYGDSLRARIIEDFQEKPERILENGVINDPNEAAAGIAKAKRQARQFVQNEYENTEQIRLKDSLRLLGESAESEIKNDFSWPPVDDTSVNELLEIFPPSESKGVIFEELESLRRQKIAELKQKEMFRASAPGKDTVK